MNEQPRTLGTHLLLELNECNATLLDDMELVKRALLDAAAEAGATVVGEVFHKFSPVGVTGIVCIAESHNQHPHLARTRLCRRGHLHLRREVQASRGCTSHCQKPASPALQCHGGQAGAWLARACPQPSETDDRLGRKTSHFLHFLFTLYIHARFP